MRNGRRSTILVWLLAVLCPACGPEIETISVADVQPALPGTQELRAIPLPPEETGRSKLYAATADGRTVGYVVLRQAVSRSGPFQVRVILDASCQVQRADVVEYPHRRGRGVLSRNFAEQFAGMGPGDRRNIDAVTGATSSSQAVSKAVREAIDLAVRKSTRSSRPYESPRG